MDSPILHVSEIFGPTLQGEGKSLGMPCMFLRTAGCNLACGFCDTPYTWDWQRYDPRAEVRAVGLDEVWAHLAAAPVRNLVVSGGEPMLQQDALSPLLARLHEAGWWTELETAGTVAPRAGLELPRQLNVSPKLASSGNPLARRRVDDALRALRDTGRAIWKFVVCRAEDLDEIDALVAAHELSPVYLMPEGTDEGTLRARMAWMAPLAIARGYHLTPRLHVAIWGARRGV